MTELVDRIVARVDVDRAVAEKAVGIILDFLSKEGPADKVQDLLAHLPGHDALIAQANGANFVAKEGTFSRAVWNAQHPNVVVVAQLEEIASLLTASKQGENSVSSESYA